MSRNYSRNTFLRQTPNRLLKEYFARKGLLGEIDFDSLKETEIDSIGEALDRLDERTQVEAEFQQVNEMAYSAGEQVLLEEASSPFHRLDWSLDFGQMRNSYERAFWAFLNHPEVFSIALELAFMDRVGGWKERFVGQGLTPAVSQEDKDRLAEGLRAFYRKQGRGRNCHVDSYRREEPERHCYFVYPEDVPATHMGYDESGFHHWPVRPAFEVIFVYRPGSGVLEVFAKGKAKDIEKLQEIFCRTILGLDGLPDKRLRRFDLEPLKDKTFRFRTDPSDGVDGVYVKLLRFEVPGSGNRRITFEASPSGDGKAIYKLIDRALAKQDLALADLFVAKAKLQFKFAATDGKKGKSLTFEISTPDRCTLKDDPPDQIAKKYIERWGLVHGWISSTTGK